MDTVLPYVIGPLVITGMGVFGFFYKKRDSAIEVLQQRMSRVEQNWARIEGKLDLLIAHVQFKK